jgi:hypothetical protein
VLVENHKTIAMAHADAGPDAAGPVVGTIAAPELTTADHHREQQRMVRERQWLYLGPIAAAPLAHISVTRDRHAKTTLPRRLIVGVGILGASLGAVGMRIGLMAHAG